VQAQLSRKKKKKKKKT